MSNPDQNLILEVYEGALENGYVGHEPAFGRWFKDGNKCYIGFFADDNDWDPYFSGKGIYYLSDGTI